MTVLQIHKALNRRKKVSLRHTRFYIKKFGISHVGPRQRPQQYPNNSADRIVEALGLTENGKVAA